MCPLEIALASLTLPMLFPPDNPENQGPLCSHSARCGGASVTFADAFVWHLTSMGVCIGQCLAHVPGRVDTAREQAAAPEDLDGVSTEAV